MRAIGLTTRAILAAPKDAHYVVATLQHVDYVKRLAKHLGRDDLLVVPLSYFESMRHTGSKRGVYADHYALDFALRRDMSKALEAMTEHVWRMECAARS